MRKSLVRKGLVLGIIILFIGASITTSIGSLEKEHNKQLLPNQSKSFNGASRWDYNWTYYRIITIDHSYIDTSLSNFPVLVVIDSTVGSKCDDGDSIRFFLPDNVTELYYEIEEWDASDDSFVWVNVTSISSTSDTVFLLHYNNSDAVDNQQPENVWDSNFRGVYHMHDADGNIIDSSNLGEEGEPNSNPSYHSSGKISYSIEFDGNYDYFSNCIPKTEIDTNDCFIEFWCKPDLSDTYGIVFGWYHSSNNRLYLGQSGEDGGKWWTGWGSQYDAWGSANTDWHYFAYRATSSNILNGYLDDSISDGVSLDSNPFSTGNSNIFIGTGVQDTGGYSFNGKIDEVRYSNITRNKSWRLASYHTQNQTTGFLVFGDEHYLNYPPIANFTYTPQNPIQKDTIQFNDNSYDPDGIITTWLWDFGDGNASTLQNPTHIYDDWGTYTVTLNVTDNLGKIGETSQQINVLNLAPFANFTYIPTNPIVNESIYFTDTSIDLDGTIVSWMWIFDDGYSSTVQNPVHQYSNYGSYDVMLTVTDDDGATDEVSKIVNLENIPPNTPSNPSPTNHATDVDINANLYWSGGDPDPGDIVTYDVYFGTSSSPPQVATGQSGTTYDPGTMSYSTTYYWKIVSWDNHGASTTGPIWEFTTGSEPNDPPNPPSDPSPEDDATDVSIDTLLGWTCSDPDGDALVYDVYLEADDPTPDILVSDDQAGTSYDPDGLEYGTLYYWQIIAKDSHSATTEGPIWSFTTEEATPDLDCDGTLSWNNVVPGSTVINFIYVENIGEPGSLLDWEIDEYPDWGDWTLTPSSGDDLLPNNPVTIGVTVIAPDEPEETFTGEVVLVNSEDPDDTCIIDVSLATPVNQQVINPLLQMLLERFPLLQRLLSALGMYAV